MTDPKELGTTAEELTKSKTFKELVAEKLTDREFLKQGFCGVVTLTSGAYLLHKSGVLVKIQKHWIVSSLATVGLLAAGGVATYFAPDMMKKAAQAALSGATNPYTATGFAATAGAVYAGSKFKNRWAQAGAGLTTGGAIAGLGVAHELGYFEGAKNALAQGASYVAGQTKDFASYAALKGADFAQAHPYITRAAAVTGAAAGLVGLGWVGYKGINNYLKSDDIRAAKGAFAVFKSTVIASRPNLRNMKLGLDRFEQSGINFNLLTQKQRDYVQAVKDEVNGVIKPAVIKPAAQPSMWSKARSKVANNSVVATAAQAVKPWVYNRSMGIGTGLAAIAGLGYAGYRNWAPISSWTSSVAKKASEFAAPYVTKAAQSVSIPSLKTAALVGTGLTLTSGATYAGVKGKQYLNNSNNEARAAKAAFVLFRSQVEAAEAAKSIQDLEIALANFEAAKINFALLGQDAVEFASKVDSRIKNLKLQLRQAALRRSVAPQVQQQRRAVVASVRPVVAPVVNRSNQVTQIPALLNNAIRGDKAALAQAKANAGNDRVLVALINDYMNSNVVNFLRNCSRQPTISTAKLNAFYRQEKDLIEELAAKCGVAVTALIPVLK